VGKGEGGTGGTLLTSAKVMILRFRVAQAPSPVRIGDSPTDTAEGGCATFLAPMEGHIITFAEVNSFGFRRQIRSCPDASLAVESGKAAHGGRGVGEVHLGNGG